MTKMTKREFMIQHKAFEQGMVTAYRGILYHCKSCIAAHRKEMTKQRLLQIADMNERLWK